MNRRSALKNVLFVTAGAALIPGCLQDKSTLQFEHLSLTGNQEKMLTALSAAIVPTTKEFMGAAEVKAHQFALMMVDECEGPDMQEKFTEGMKDFEKMTDKKYNKRFDTMNDAQQKEMLLVLEKQTGVPESVQTFYKSFKMYTIEAFVSSAKYMTDVRKYKMVPGSNFKGCVPVG